MPGPSPAAAVEAFLEPLREAMACLGGAHFDLSRGARGDVGEVHGWTLNRDEPVSLSDGLALRARMHFEVVDKGRDARRQRYRVTTHSYMYEVLDGSRRELFSAHWHPRSPLSSFENPHYHICAPALSTSGVFMERAHLPTHRVSFEEFIRICIDQFGVAPAVPDWKERLHRTEQVFQQYQSWG